MGVDYTGMIEDLKGDLKKASDKNKRSEEQAKKTSELKRCAFCGGEAKLCCTYEQNHINYYWIYCKECGCKHPSSIHREAVIKAWNTRTPMDKVIERLEELRMRAVENDCSIAEAGECYSIYCETCYMDRAIGIVIEEVG